MRHSNDPQLLAIAKDALEDIQWSIPSDHVQRLGSAIRGSGKMPKNVKQPKIGGPIFTGVFLQGKYRCLAFCPDVITAARMADVIVLKLDEWRKIGVVANPIVQRAVLNFTLEDAQKSYEQSESLQSWWGRLLGHLTTSGILVESGGPSDFVRTGRPKSASNAQIEELKEQIKNLEHKLDTILSHLAMTHVIIGPSNPSTPTQPAIGWPLPAPVGDFPIVTCGDSANAPKPT